MHFEDYVYLTHFESRVGAKSTGICFKKSNFQKTNFSIPEIVTLVKLVTFVRGWDAQSRISRDKKILKIPTKSSI